MSDKDHSVQETVRQFLLDNPRFLADNPELLQQLELNHSTGTASSLIERQVETLRVAKQDADQQLRRLMRVAADNEALMSRLHSLTIQLLSTGSQQDFFVLLEQALLQDFNASQVRIHLRNQESAAEGALVTELNSDNPAWELIQAQLEKDGPVCGRHSSGKIQFLFGPGSEIKSAAVVPLGENSEGGILAIGSSDEARFFPDMGTVFLQLLAKVIDARLAEDSATPEPASGQLRTA